MVFRNSKPLRMTPENIPGTRSKYGLTFNLSVIFGILDPCKNSMGRLDISVSDMEIVFNFSKRGKKFLSQIIAFSKSSLLPSKTIS
eukprot:Awhi_evm1s1729